MKKSTNEGNLFNVYKMNCSEMNTDLPSFVFKISCVIAQVAFKMDVSRTKISALMPCKARLGSLQFLTPWVVKAQEISVFFGSFSLRSPVNVTVEKQL